MDDCIFCNISLGKAPAEIIDESDHFLAIKDIHPRVPGHALIIAKEHYSTLLDIPHNLGEELVSFTKHVASSLLEQGNGEGFNIVMNNFPVAGQIVMHAHLHVLPRKEGDGVKPVA